MENLIGKKVSAFKTQAYHEGEFKEITSDAINGQWSVFFFYPLILYLLIY